VRVLWVEAGTMRVVCWVAIDLTLAHHNACLWYARNEGASE
jgi:hypothetical protein